MNKKETKQVLQRDVGQALLHAIGGLLNAAEEIQEWLALERIDGGDDRAIQNVLEDIDRAIAAMQSALADIIERPRK